MRRTCSTRERQTTSRLSMTVLRPTLHRVRTPRLRRTPRRRRMPALRPTRAGPSANRTARATTTTRARSTYAATADACTSPAAPGASASPEVARPVAEPIRCAAPAAVATSAYGATAQYARAASSVTSAVRGRAVPASRALRAWAERVGEDRDVSAARGPIRRSSTRSRDAACVSGVPCASLPLAPGRRNELVLRRRCAW